MTTLVRHDQVMQDSGARPGEHTTPVLVFTDDGGERMVTRKGDAGEFGVFVHCVPGAAIFSLPPGIDRQLTGEELSLATKHLRMFARSRGDWVTPIVSFDGLPLELGPIVELNSVEPMAGHRFDWGGRSCALVVTKTVDPLLEVTTGQVYTYDHDWVDPKPGVMDRLFGRFFND